MDINNNKLVMAVRELSDRKMRAVDERRIYTNLKIWRVDIHWYHLYADCGAALWYTR